MRAGIAAAVLVVGIAAPAAWAEDIHVPGDFRRLRDALAAAAPGDRILLEDGVHRGPFVVTTSDIVIQGDGGRIVQGARALRSRSAEADAAIVVRADRVTLKSLDLLRGGIRVEGDDVRVQFCHVERFSDRRHAAVGIEVTGARASVLGNQLLGGRWAFHGVRITGPDAFVSRMTILDGPGGRGIEVNGDGARVVDNRFQQAVGEEAIVVEGMLPLVEANFIRYDEGQAGAILVTGDGATIRDNEIEADRLDGSAIHVEGDDALVEDNEAVADGATAILVRGDRNRILVNVTMGNPNRFFSETAFRFGHGISVRGSDNLLSGNRLYSSPADSIRILGGATNTIDDCQSYSAGACGLLNVSQDSVVTGSQFTSSSIDVFNGGSFALFDTTWFNSGGVAPQPFGGGTELEDDLGILVDALPGGSPIRIRGSD